MGVDAIEMAYKMASVGETPDSSLEAPERRRHDEAAFAPPGFFVELQRGDPDIVWPIYTRMRNEAPVWWSDEASSWVVSGYENVRAILLDTPRFSNKPHARLYGAYDDPNAGSFFVLDPPDHGRVRRIFTGGGSYSAAAMSSIRPLMQDVSIAALAQLPDDFDAVRDLAVPVTTDFFIRFFDLPEVRTDESRWQDAQVWFYLPGAEDATPGLIRYFERLVKMRRDDLHEADPLSVAIRANQRAGLLTTAQMAWNFHDIVLAGSGALWKAIAACVGVLAQYPEAQHLRYWDSGDAIKRSVEELVRHSVGPHWVFRVATEDVEVGGKLIRSGQGVVLMMASANRDEAVWADGQVLDLGREVKPHLAFGCGPHMTPGAAMSRAFLAAMLPILIRARAPFHLSKTPERILWAGVTNTFEYLIAAGLPRRGEDARCHASGLMRSPHVQ